MIQKELEDKESQLEQSLKQKVALEIQRDAIAANLMKNNDIPQKLM